ncbi:MAG: hypothetical protein AAF385_09825 [Pseudomonadota bacterium]
MSISPRAAWLVSLTLSRVFNSFDVDQYHEARLERQQGLRMG